MHNVTVEHINPGKVDLTMNVDYERASEAARNASNVTLSAGKLAEAEGAVGALEIVGEDGGVFRIVVSKERGEQVLIRYSPDEDLPKIDVNDTEVEVSITGPELNAVHLALMIISELVDSGAPEDVRKSASLLAGLGARVSMAMLVKYEEEGKEVSA